MPRANSCPTREIHDGRIFPKTFWIGVGTVLFGMYFCHAANVATAMRELRHFIRVVRFAA
jgi:hypothetical protein